MWGKPFYTARPCHGKTTTTTPIFHHLPLHGQWSLSIVSPMVRSTVTAIKEFLPNGQVNGYCHQELLTGYQRFENIFCCLLQVSRLLQLYFHLFVVKSLKTLNYSYFPQKTLSQAGLFSHMTMVSEAFLLNGQWSRRVFSPMVSPMVTAIQELLPNGQPNGHGHLENFPNGQWSRPFRIDHMERLAQFQIDNL